MMTLLYKMTFGLVSRLKMTSICLSIEYTDTYTVYVDNVFQTFGVSRKVVSAPSPRFQPSEGQMTWYQSEKGIKVKK